MNSSCLVRSRSAGIFAGLAAILLSPHAPLAKSPGETYCIKDVCRRVLTLQETAAAVGTEDWQTSSFYDACDVDPGNPCTGTSSGEAFDPNSADNAASPIYPDGTVLELYYPATEKRLRVRPTGPAPRRDSTRRSTTSVKCGKAERSSTISRWSTTARAFSNTISVRGSCALHRGPVRAEGRPRQDRQD